jgi:hypothetical protein
MKLGPVGALMDTLVFRRQFRTRMEQSLAALKGMLSTMGQLKPALSPVFLMGFMIFPVVARGAASSRHIFRFC